MGGFVFEQKAKPIEAESKIDRDTFFFVKDDNYDEHVEAAIPFYREMHQELALFGPTDLATPVKILDLGVGTGKTSEVFLERYLQSSIVGVDLFDEMLGHARNRLAHYGDRATLVKGDFRNVSFGGDYDLCVSALSLHHLKAVEKSKLFRRIAEALKPNGLFLMIDWTKFRSPKIERAASDNAEHHVRTAVPDSAVVANWCNHWKFENIPDRVEDLITSLLSSGFDQAECVMRHYGMALIVAEASAGS